MVDYYVRDKNINGPAEHIGYSYILPLNLQENKGTIKTVITGINHKPIGHLMGLFTLFYLFIYIFHL